MSGRPHFLELLLRRKPPSVRLVNTRTGLSLASRVELAGDSKSRRRGLLGRETFPQQEALVLAPCGAVHTWFMRFAIDVLFVSRDGRVLKTYEGLLPWRIAFAWGAFAAVELPANTFEHAGVRAGDVLMLVPDQSDL